MSHKSIASTASPLSATRHQRQSSLSSTTSSSASPSHLHQHRGSLSSDGGGSSSDLLGMSRTESGKGGGVEVAEAQSQQQDVSPVEEDEEDKPTDDSADDDESVLPSIATSAVFGGVGVKDEDGPLPQMTAGLSPAQFAAVHKGTSCHQCKNTKQLKKLAFCANLFNKRTKPEKRVCRKKYCETCFPEHDTRVLTSAGFLFLSEIEKRVETKQPVQYACYDVRSQAIVYRNGKLVLPTVQPTHWVDFTQSDTRTMWDVTSSDESDAAVPVDGVRANRLTLRTTPDHDMFVQPCMGGEETGTDSQFNAHGARGTPIAPHKMTAQELVPGYQCNCATVGSSCTHGYSHYRMFTGAASGLQLCVDRISLTNTDAHSPVVALSLCSQDELDAFLSLFGYWLGDGTLSHGTRAGAISNDAVLLACNNERDHLYLLGLLARLHLEQGHHFISNESDSQLVVRIIEPRWFRYFDNKFGGKYSDSASATASRTRASSVSVSDNSSVSMSADYSGDENDDISPFKPELVEEAGDVVKLAKWLPEWSLFQLDAQQLRLVIDGLRRADGGSAAAAVGKAVQGSCRIRTSSASFRDQLVQACLHAGYSAYFTLDAAAGSVRGYNAVPKDNCMYTAKEMEAALQVDSPRQFETMRHNHDSWWVCYSEKISELLSAQDVRFDANSFDQQLATTFTTQTGNLYDRERDGRAWCVDVQHADHLIFVQRAHRDSSGVVTKVGRTMISGNCLKKFYNDNLSDIVGKSWICASCRGVCCCAACTRVGSKKAGKMEGATVGSGMGSAQSLSPPTSSSTTPIGSAHSTPSFDKRTLQQTAQMDTMPLTALPVTAATVPAMLPSNAAPLSFAAAANSLALRQQQAAMQADIINNQHLLATLSPAQQQQIQQQQMLLYNQLQQQQLQQQILLNNIQQQQQLVAALQIQQQQQHQHQHPQLSAVGNGALMPLAPLAAPLATALSQQPLALPLPLSAPIEQDLSTSMLRHSLHDTPVMSGLPLSAHLSPSVSPSTSPLMYTRTTRPSSGKSSSPSATKRLYMNARDWPYPSSSPVSSSRAVSAENSDTNSPINATRDLHSAHSTPQSGYRGSVPATTAGSGGAEDVRMEDGGASAAGNSAFNAFSSRKDAVFSNLHRLTQQGDGK